MNPSLRGPHRSIRFLKRPIRFPHGTVSTPNESSALAASAHSIVGTVRFDPKWDRFQWLNRSLRRCMGPFRTENGPFRFQNGPIRGPHRSHSMFISVRFRSGNERCGRRSGLPFLRNAFFRKRQGRRSGAKDGPSGQQPAHAGEVRPEHLAASRESPDHRLPPLHCTHLQ